MLAVDVQRFTAGGENRRSWAARLQPVNQVRGDVQQMLAVVDDDDGCVLAEGADQAAHRVVERDVPDADRVCGRIKRTLRVSGRSEIDPRHRGFAGGGEVMRDMECEPSFADAAGPVQRDHAGLGE